MELYTLNHIALSPRWVFTIGLILYICGFGLGFLGACLFADENRVIGVCCAIAGLAFVIIGVCWGLGLNWHNLGLG